MARTRNDYIPRPDGDFDAWAQQFTLSVEQFWTKNNLPKDLYDNLKTALELWQADYPAHTAAQAAAESARSAKDAARTALMAAVRPVARIAQTFPLTTDADRAEWGITVRDGGRTPTVAPTTRPRVLVSTTARLGHTLRLVDEDPTATGTPMRSRVRRPDGCMGAELWVKLVNPGDPTPLDPAAFTFLQMATKPVIRTDFKPVDGGKTAAYMLRWVSTRGEVGPWSEVATGTVAA